MAPLVLVHPETRTKAASHDWVPTLAGSLLARWRVCGHYVGQKLREVFDDIANRLLSSRGGQVRILR